MTASAANAVVGEVDARENRGTRATMNDARTEATANMETFAEALTMDFHLALVTFDSEVVAVSTEVVGRVRLACHRLPPKWLQK